MVGRYRAKPGRMVMPDICCDIVWAAGRLTFTGPMTRARPTVHAGLDVTLFSFDPLDARAMIAAPLIDLTDQIVALDDVAPHLVDPILSWIDSGAAGARSGSAPVVRAEPDDRLRLAARSLRDGNSVGGTASAISLGERQFERVFETEFGVRPKVYARILRVRRAIQLIKSGVTLAAAAADAGYCDQSHFNRDVRNLTGLAPTNLLPNVGNVQDALPRGW